MNLPETTINLLISGLMGAIGGLLSIPINAFISWKLKREELYYQHKLDVIAKERELFLQHRLEMKRKNDSSNEIAELREAIRKLEREIYHG